MGRAPRFQSRHPPASATRCWTFPSWYAPGSPRLREDFNGGWYQIILTHGVRPNTYKLRKHLINKHIVPHIGARSLVELTSDDIRFLVRRWKDDAVGATTQRTALVALSSALSVALREEKIGRNSCSTVPTPKPKRPEVLVLDGQQVMQLLGAARDVQERALFALAIKTGMRQGEIFALSWADLDFDAGTVSVRATLTEDLDGKLVRSEPKTTKSRRVIYLPALALKALLAHQSERQGERGFVFTAADGPPLRKSNFVWRVFKPLLRQAELPDVTFHSLRHTANSLLIEAGEDPLAIAGSLGNAETRMMFERYGHLFSHSGRRVAKMADEIFAALETNCRYNCRKCGGSLRSAASKKNPQTLTGCRFGLGGDEETRTPDPLHAKQVLYQLSYIPKGAAHHSTGGPTDDTTGPLPGNLLG